MNNKHLFTSESVTEGHPDKVCNLILDSILDTYLEKDPSAHVAVKTVVKNNTVFAAGEHSYFLQAAVSDHSGGKPGRCREPRLPSRQHDPRIHAVQHLR